MNKIFEHLIFGFGILYTEQLANTKLSFTTFRMQQVDVCLCLCVQNRRKTTYRDLYKYNGSFIFLKSFR